MNNIKIYKINEINLNNIIYSKPDESSETKLIYLKYNHNSHKTPLLIQLPDLYMIDDIKELNINSNVTHEILLPIIGKTDETTNQVKNFIESLDNKVINDVQNHINIWPFKTNEIKYKLTTKHVNNTTNKIYSNGILKFKLLKSKSFKTNIYKSNKEIINDNMYKKIITGNNYIKSIIEIAAIWIKNDTVGLYIRPHQFRISEGGEPIHVLNKYSFIEDTEMDINNVYDTEINNDTCEDKHNTIKENESEQENNFTMCSETEKNKINDYITQSNTIPIFEKFDNNNSVNANSLDSDDLMIMESSSD